MRNMKMQSPDAAKASFDRLAALFPSVIRESRSPAGSLARTVDYEALAELLGAPAATGNEPYEFTWPGKREARAEAARPVRKTLRPCPEESVNWEITENLYIEGDNLDVLKLLQENYLGKVKFIYIDPPYNTGNDFIYRDSFRQDTGAHKLASGAVMENPDGEYVRLVANTQANGRFHSDWCSMIYPRLLLARNLLANDGIIFISCDDNEHANLKKICDEVFGEANFIANFAIENNPKGRKNNLFVSGNYEHCLLYAKNSTHIYEKAARTGQHKFFRNMPGAADDRPMLADEYGNFRQSKRQICGSNTTCGIAAASSPERRFAIYYDSRQERLELLNEYDPDKDEYVISQKGRKLLNNGWKRYAAWNSREQRPGVPLFTKETLAEMFAAHSLYFRDDCIYGKERDDSRQITSLITNKKFNLDLMTESATAGLGKLLGDNGIFQNSKALDFIAALLFLYPENDFICLDFFAGSSTTAHAVMRLNAQDGGKRKFIMIQLPEICPNDSEAAKAGYANICEIGKERIRRAGKKIKKENPQAQNTDTGFRVFKCDSSNMKDVYYTPQATAQNSLPSLISNIREDRSDADLLFQCVLDLGLELSLPHETQIINGHKAHFYNGNELVCCFADNIELDAITAIAKTRPLAAVFRDSAFSSSAARMNISQHFQEISPHTDIRVL